MSVELQTDETIALKALVQALAKRLAGAVVIFESIQVPVDCRVERQLLRQAQALAPQNDKFVTLVAR